MRLGRPKICVSALIVRQTDELTERRSFVWTVNRPAVQKRHTTKQKSEDRSVQTSRSPPRSRRQYCDCTADKRSMSYMLYCTVGEAYVYIHFPQDQVVSFSFILRSDTSVFAELGKMKTKHHPQTFHFDNKQIPFACLFLATF